MKIAKDWFALDAVGDGVTRIWEPHVHPLMQANMWHVRGREADLLVDSGMGVGDLAGTLRAAGLIGERPLLLVLTHVHPDHSGGAHQFWPRLVHHAEASLLSEDDGWHPLVAAEYSPDLWRALMDQEGDGGGAPTGVLVDALPHAGFSPRRFTVTPATATLRVGEGDVLDLGERRLRVLHLPGHSPGSLALWEVASATLYAGDVVYDHGLLLDELTGSSIPDYYASMKRLLDLPVRTVHAGHGLPFGPDLLRDRAREYLERREGRW